MLGVAAAVVAPTLALAADGGRSMPRQPLVSAGDATVAATVGTHCVRQTSEAGEPVGGYCADYRYPLATRGRLPVEPRGLVRLRFRDNPQLADDVTGASVSLIRRRGEDFESLRWSASAVPVDDGSGTFRVRLPERLRGANVLSVTVGYDGGGDANFWAGLDARGRDGGGVPKERLCPRGDREHGFDTARLVGRHIRSAVKLARRHDCTVRVIERDGHPRAITKDLRFDRVNVVREGDRVTRVDGVY